LAAAAPNELTGKIQYLAQSQQLAEEKAVMAMLLPEMADQVAGAVQLIKPE